MTVPGTVLLLQAAELATEAEIKLATRLGLPLVTAEQLSNEAEFCLHFTGAGLSLSILEDKAPGPFTIDFNSPKLLRRSGDALQKQLLGKALGLNRHQGQSVLDATAGTGSDAFLMAMAGCSVTLLERSEIVAELLSDALQRAAQSPAPVSTAVSRMQLYCEDFLSFNQETGQYDVVYLDPMFPEDSRSARSQKAMYVLQRLLGKADDDEQLLLRGLTLAKRRVVVKRNRRSPLMPGPEPDIQFKGSSSRYDVYLTGLS